ncbi:MAG: methylmalonyl Co-A mutase-associated GTPase MeaB [Chloroflexota bacterium]|nr:MAG: methylmalonyl Co-A mutase-associated GTPase MeaB [Chloroflexota bacterium]
MNLVEDVLAGDRRALARVITLIENNLPGGQEALRILFRHGGKAHVIGVTGPPGAGKSTLVCQLAKELRARGKTVGIVAVDPSSPFTGGAILGDRIRMQELSGDRGVFARSMATRGELGGMAKTTQDVVDVLDASGFDVVIVETVGVGQDEVTIAGTAHTTLVVGVPGLGDDVQAIKAGVLEIADIYVVNKADREGAEMLVAQLQMLLTLRELGNWAIPIQRTVATRGEGISELVDAAQRHYRHLSETGLLRQQSATHHQRRVLDIARDALLRKLLTGENSGERLSKLVQEVVEHRLDPYTAAEQLARHE